MKTYLILLSLLIAGIHPTFAQEIDPTTAREYNYGAVGYRIQLQSGMSDNPGYSIRKIDQYEDPERKVEMMGMYRDGENEPCAVIMVYTRIRTAPMYFCMPTRNAPQELWEKFEESLSDGTDNPHEQLEFFSTCIAKLAMNFSTGNTTAK
jgi:hypothetical protein